MITIRRRFCLTVIATVLSLFSLSMAVAEETAPIKKSGAPSRKEKLQTKPADVPAPRPALSLPAEITSTDSSAEAIFQVLLAEIALRRGNAQLASSAYADLAQRTRDPKVLERTVDVAGFARRFDLALDAARLWVEVDPGSKRAQYVLASVLVMSNQTADLAPVLIRMLEVDKAALTENLLGLNRMLARNPDRRAVFQLIEQVCRPFFGLAEAHYAVSVAAAGAGQDERARAEVRRALELRPEWEMAAMLQAQLLARLSVEDAIIYLKDFVDNAPVARDARMQLARMLVGAKRHDDARQQFDQVLKLNPDSPDAVFSSAILALQQNDLALAETHLKHFLTLPVTDKNYAYFFLGQIAEEHKQSVEAIAYYDRVQGGEHFVQAKLRGARLLVDQGQPETARTLLISAKASSPGDSVTLTIAEAGLLRDAHQIQAAFDLLESALSQSPEQPDLLYETALLAEKLGNFELMETRLRHLIKLRPESAQGYNALGYSLADRNLRLPEARELIEKAFSIAPNDYFILDSLGWILFRQGDLTGALSYLEKAMSLRYDPEIAVHMGEVLWALGRQEEARQMWFEAQKKFPANDALIDVLKKFLP